MYTIQEYKEALLYNDSFKTLTIKPVKNEQGEFIFNSGRTAVVFKVKDEKDGRYKALKCFTLFQEADFDRFHIISRYLQWIKSPYLVSYRFLQEEIWIDDAFRPVVLMDWVEGNILQHTLERLCRTNNRKEILDIALQFDQMALWFLSKDFAHGDLKADNLILTPGKHLVAVDYEGFFVPELEGEQALELGTEEYQHPARDADFFSRSLDDISILVISTALHALVHRPELWQLYHKGENILFTYQDLKHPGETEVWKSLLELDNSLVVKKLNLLHYALTSPLGHVKDLFQVLYGEVEEAVTQLKEVIKSIPKSGELDLSLNGGLKNIPIFNGIVKHIEYLPSGKILVGGYFSKSIALLNQDGSLDWHFWKNIKDGFSLGGVETIKLQQDGRIIIGGSFRSFSGNRCRNIARLFLDGSYDKTFVTGDGFDFDVHSLALQSDGKILVGGRFRSYDGDKKRSLVRLFHDGSLDKSFDTGNGFDGHVNTIAIQSDGKILVGGWFTKYNHENSNGITRLLSNGSMDKNFVKGAGFSGIYISIKVIKLQPDGRILVGGSFSSYNREKVSNFARLYSDGSLDKKFSAKAKFDNTVSAVALCRDKRILVGGEFWRYKHKKSLFFAQLLPNGSLDVSFYYGKGVSYYRNYISRLLKLSKPSSKKRFNKFVTTISEQLDGKILIGGKFTSYNVKRLNHIVRLLPDNSLDKSFGAVVDFFKSYIDLVALQSDGKILLIYRTFKYGTPTNIARLLPDGSLDKSFKIGNGFDGFVSAIVIQPDRKILVGGSFNSYNSESSNKIVRLLPDGTLDKFFNVGQGFNMDVSALELQSDGKILVGGSFTSYNNEKVNHIVRLYQNGTLDKSFDMGEGFNDHDICISIQSDGKILVGGKFSTYNGSTCNQIARLLPDGSLDKSFDTRYGFEGLFDGCVEAIACQPDGKILAGGFFMSYNHEESRNIVRLLPDGSLDKSFHLGDGFKGSVNVILLQSDGKILIGGYFSFYDGQPCNRLVRLLPTGKIDPDFDVGAGFDASVRTLAITSDNKLLVGGNFMTYDNHVCNGIARIHL